MRAKEAEKKMTKRIEVARAPAPLEEYVKHFEKGEDDPAFQTKLTIALELVERAHTQGIPFRALVDAVAEGPAVTPLETARLPACSCACTSTVR